jgi:ubiquinone/menaquinone biosynthesis C-methylase UbiE
MSEARAVPNHHAHHPGFRGVPGFTAALCFTVGRGAAARLAADRTGVHLGDHVVDIGCGPGTAVREARRRGATATGVDPAAVMLRVARRLSRGSGTSWLLGAAEDLPLDDGVATVAWSLATVHHWQDVAQGLAEVRRVLQTDGRFLVAERRTTPDARGLRSHGWTEAQAEAFGAACTAAGFADVDVDAARAGRTATLVVTARRPRDHRL